MKINYKLVCVLTILLIHPNSMMTETVESQSEEEITYALPFDFPEYSMFTERSYATAQWTSAVYGSLIKRSMANNRNWSPNLARSMPSISEDGLAFTFELRDNLFFSNGDPLTVEDIEFSMKAIVTPNINTGSYSAYAEFLDNNSMTIISSNSFMISLKEKTAFPYGILSFGIVPKDYFNSRYENCLDGISADCSWNSADGSDAISAGPYMITEINTINEIVTVETNPYWYDAVNVRINKIIFKKIAEKNVALSSLADGSIHLLDSQYVPGLTELDGLDGVSEAFIGELITQELSLNHKHPYFGTGEMIPNSDGATAEEKYENARLLRKAMSLIMDRNTYVTEMMEGLAEPAATTMPSTSMGWDSDIQPDPYDPDYAKSIMENLGFNYTQLGTPNNDTGQYTKSFFNLTILQPNSGGVRFEWPSDYMLQLPKIGIGIKQHVATGWANIIPRTFGSSIDPGLYEEGGYDVFFVGYSWGLEWNPFGVFDGSGSCSTGNCRNFYNFDLNENLTPIAGAIQDYLTELDFDARLEKVKIVQELLAHWLPVVPIFYPQSHWGWATDVTGIDPLLLSVGALEWEHVGRTGVEFGDIDDENDNSERLILFFPFIYFIVSIPIINILNNYVRRIKRSS